jgi:hypothetical protein
VGWSGLLVHHGQCLWSNSRYFLRQVTNLASAGAEPDRDLNKKLEKIIKDYQAMPENFKKIQA